MNIEATSADHLLAILAGIDITVPGWAERTTEQVERWSIARFLSTYARLPLVAYPLQVTHRDRPDVLLRMAARNVGMEVVKAVPSNWAKTRALHQARAYDTLMFTPQCQPGEASKPTAELDQVARGENNVMPWMGDSPERSWADAMLHFTEEKVAKFAKPGFAVFERNWLLIYDDWPAPAVDEPRAADYFVAKLADRGGTRPFDAIFVETSQHFWRFEGGRAEQTQINDLW